ncbi:Ubiquitin-conjugating enzyme [Paramyrothecium foliicola]|nr:Ubiquitin-conjugating enzyme [Paramyrothecium foliicola]
MSTKRITKEFAEISQNPPEGFTVSLPSNASIHTWHITLTPDASSPYSPGRYGIILTLPTDYPFKPPIVKFVTRLYHPNVSNDSLGGICLALLKPDVWKPSTKIASVLEALRNLLLEPQPDDPLEDRIAEEYRNDRPAWEKNVKLHVERYALAEPVFPAS